MFYTLVINIQMLLLSSFLSYRTTLCLLTLLEASITPGGSSPPPPVWRNAGTQAGCQAALRRVGGVEPNTTITEVYGPRGPSCVSVKPSVLLRSEDPPPGHHPAMLVCSVYDFYPEHIKVSWFRDGQEVTSGVTSTDEWANADQIHSHLVYTPRAGEKISCVVEHASLTEPLYTDWDPSMPESERNKIAIGASGLVLGLILSLAGFIYYKRKARGRTLVPTS
ncbi:H-2 class II histocompatibility antigen, I-A beta chain-like [Aulostomus maculatus]